jgi:AcrR family transcriptional regulator
MTAAVDPAVVIRLFGSKEALFAAVAADAFNFGPAFALPLHELAQAIATHLVDDAAPDHCPPDFDTFRFLLHSAASPIAAPILSASMHAGFVAPLAVHLGGEAGEARAALFVSIILGISTLRFGLRSPLWKPLPETCSSNASPPRCKHVSRVSGLAQAVSQVRLGQFPGQAITRSGDPPVRRSPGPPLRRPATDPCRNTSHRRRRM